MAYMRGKYYIWGDGGWHVYFWAGDGRDHWEGSHWIREAEAHPAPSGNVNYYPTFRNPKNDEALPASGVSIPQSVMDEYVVMRFAEMIKENLAEAALQRACESWHSPLLCKTSQTLLEAIRTLNARTQDE